MCLPSFLPFSIHLCHLASVISDRKRNETRKREKRLRGMEIASCSCSLHVSIDDGTSGWDNIMGPEAMQLSASVYCISLVNPSATLFPSGRKKTSSRAFYSSPLFLSITASQLCSSFSCLPPCLPSNSKCSGALANNVCKQWAHNCYILFLCSPSFTESLRLKN